VGRAEVGIDSVRLGEDGGAEVASLSSGARGPAVPVERDQCRFGRTVSDSKKGPSVAATNNIDSAAKSRLYPRDKVEFNRVNAFGDGVFAIAMTLLIVTVQVPPDISLNQLVSRLRILGPEIFSFFLSFAVIGRYWLAHHQFFALLACVNRRLIRWNLVYLAFVAFLPFPTALLGEYPEIPFSVISYALSSALVSSLETMVFTVGVKDHLFERALPHDVYRFGMMASLAPVAVFAFSTPLALWKPAAGMLFWLLIWPIEFFLDRFKPPGADSYWE
jgi:uncharacterized membrane protein